MNSPIPFQRALDALLILASTLCLSSCQSFLKQGSQRDIRGLARSGQLVGKARDLAPASSAPKAEIFVRKKEIVVAPARGNLDTGSLMNLEDERNYLFVQRGVFGVGSEISVEVHATRAESKSAQESTTDETGAAVGGEPATAEPVNAAEKAILEGLPDLSPREEKVGLVKRFKMIVSHHYPNGDVLATTIRKSTLANDTVLGEQDQSIHVRARIPARAIASPSGVSTEDLYDVAWTEVNEGEQISRSSSGWEDEYTARLSGFSEARSKLARELEDKRKQLYTQRLRLEEQLKSIGQERQVIAKEREDAMKIREESGSKVSELSTKLEEKESQIEVMNEELKELRQDPEEKAVDAKEAAGGA